MAQLAILDHLGCALRGLNEPLVNITANEFLGRPLTADDLLPIGESSHTIADSQQAMLHGMAAHAIDFDDTMVPAHAAHIGAGVISGVLTLARANPDLSGQAIVAAIVAGYETNVRVAQLLHSDHYQNGFHSTSSIGMFGVAAACAHLLGLTVEQTQMALGLAATQAAGIKNMFGTMAKPFNAGNTASSGVLAAKLVSGGFTAPFDSLEGHNGYLGLFEGLSAEKRIIAPTNQYFILQNNYKFHAACLWTHGTIDGIVKMREQHGFLVADVEKLDIRVHPILRKSAAVGTPLSGLDCKFSYSQIGAYALAGYDTAADETYSDAILADETINALRQKVTATADPSLDLAVTELAVALTDGRQIEFTYDSSYGPEYVVEVEPRLIEKYMGNAEPVLGKAGATALLDYVLNLA